MLLRLLEILHDTVFVGDGGNFEQSLRRNGHAPTSHLHEQLEIGKLSRGSGTGLTDFDIVGKHVFVGETGFDDL